MTGLRDIAARITSFSGLLEVMPEVGEERSALLDAWTTTQSSLRKYYDFINHTFDPARAGEKLSTSLVGFITYLLP